MMAAVVFSRDRACQLDLLLTSIDRNGRKIFQRIYVLYRATNEDHEEGYRICAAEHPLVQFVPDGITSFQLTATLLSAADHGCFFTDDSVLYRQLPSEIPHDALHDDVLCFSLRLGRNTTWCYPHGKTQRLPKFSRDKAALVWDWTKADGDFSYPASVDGHIFRGGTLRPALHDCPPDASPNQVEDHLVQTIGHFYNGQRLMSCFEESCLVGLPLNVVTQTHRNRNGERYPWSADSLLGHYLEGQRIDLDALDFSDIRGAHQEVRLMFR
jgi:hypothetical protein